MLSLGIEPTDHTYTQLMLAHAKKGKVSECLKLEEQAKQMHKIDPSVHRLNSIVLAYVNQNKP